MNTLRAAVPPLGWRTRDTFETTHWSVVLSAASGHVEGNSVAAEALNQLCRIYWKPLYAFLRRSGHRAEDAEELTQQFLMELLTRNPFSKLHPSKGKFRSFLIASMKNFLSHVRNKARAQKRGGHLFAISLDDVEEEWKASVERFGDRTPDEIYDLQWALALLNYVRLRLHGEYVASGKAAHFIELSRFLPGGEPPRSQAEIAESLSLTVMAVKSEVYRLRQRFGQYLRAEIANTVVAKDDIDSEIEYLIQVVSR